MTRAENARRRKEALVEAVVSLTEESGRAPLVTAVFKRADMSSTTGAKYLHELVSDGLIEQRRDEGRGGGRRLYLAGTAGEEQEPKPRRSRVPDPEKVLAEILNSEDPVFALAVLADHLGKAWAFGHAAGWADAQAETSTGNPYL